MNEIVPISASGKDRTTMYRDLVKECEPLFVDSWLSNFANLSAMLFYSLPEINWAGFYLVREKELWLGPFQGRPACITIPISKGVCGKSAQTRKAVIVEDVHQFEGHIACDASSRSEIVIPVVANGELKAVLDLDSPRVGRFDHEDQVGLEALVQILIQGTDWTSPWPILKN